jgi:hypothetical protein
MGGGYPPTRVGPQPHMALPAREGGAFALKLGIGCREISPISHDHGILQVPRQIDQRACGAREIAAGI